MEIRPIRTDADYESALKEIENLFDAEPGSPESDPPETASYSPDDPKPSGWSWYISRYLSSRV